MRRLILATVLGLGLLGGTAALAPGQAAPAPQAVSAASAVAPLPVQYRRDHRPRHYAPPSRRRAYHQRYAPPRPYYRQRYAPPRPQYRQRHVAPRYYAPPQAHYRR
jgi:hypothetical protein